MRAPLGAPRRFLLLAPSDSVLSGRVARSMAAASPQLQARWMRGHACALRPGAALPLDGAALGAAELRTLAGAAVAVEGGSVRVGGAGGFGGACAEWSALYALDGWCAVLVISAFLVQ